MAGGARGKWPVDWLEACVLRYGANLAGQRGLSRLEVAILKRDDRWDRRRSLP
jgi:hypothetical protein